MDLPESPSRAIDLSDVMVRLDRIDRRLNQLGVPDPPVEDDSGEALPIRRRRFTLLDAMILVAFSALAMPIYRAELPVIQTTELDTSDNGFGVAALLIAILWACITPVVLTWSIAVAVLRQIRPRPALRALSRQPGAFAMSVIAPLVLVVTPVHLLNTLLIESGTALGYHIFLLMIVLPKLAGGAVAGVWLALWASGRFDRVTDWVDGFGRVLCVYWLIAGLLNISIGG
jgi:hypothetical protein